jgi:mono/diheme cytochrome c family protein
MNRLIIESIEGRILLGITMFVSIMVLVGWVAINEPARMKAFEQQHLGRSIERGGELYAKNCASCHGANGYGQGGRAPALNSPQFFGHDMFAGVNTQVGRLQRQQSTLEGQVATLSARRDQLISEFINADDARKTAITAEIAEIDAQLDPNNPESITARIEALKVELEPLVAQRDDILASLQPAIDKGYLGGLLLEAEVAKGGLALTEYIDRSASRISQAAWGGDLASLIRTTLMHGRPGTADIWNQAQMVAWAQVGGGPLRNDQVNDITNFILNWDKGNNWTTDDLFRVEQFMKLKADAELAGSGGGGGVATLDTVGDLAAQVAAVTALEGDANIGKALYEGAQRTESRARLGCSSCHMGGAQAPATNETWANTLNVRLNDSALSGYTPEQYIVESVLYPNNYVVGGYASGVMPANYAAQMTAQDLAHILAYLKSYGE